MQRKTHKKTKRHLLFYKTCFGIVPPYDVIVEPAFVREARRLSQPVKDTIMKVCGGRAYPVITACCRAFLRKGGDAWGEANAITKRFQIHDCGHTQVLSPSACIKQVVGDEKKQTGKGAFLVAVHSKPLRSDIKKQCCAVPIIRFKKSSIIVDKPSAVTKAASNERLERRLSISKHEKARLEPLITPSPSTPAAPPAIPLLLGPIPVPKDTPRPIAKPRKRKAKGPNPLAMRKKSSSSLKHNGTPVDSKKRKREVTEDRAPTEDTSNAESEPAKPKQKRKRHHKKKPSAPTESDV